jgi:DNA-binding MarR family transcriptional regulator
MKVIRLSGCVAQVKVGMDRGAFFVLATLVECGEQRSSALAERVRADPSTVSRQIASLVKAGLVERRADPADGRASVLAATRTGERMVEDRKGMRRTLVRDLLADWSPGDLADLARVLPALAESYERHLPEIIERVVDFRSAGSEIDAERNLPVTVASVGGPIGDTRTGEGKNR